MPDDHSKLVPLLPIPNRTVKRLSADDTLTAAEASAVDKAKRDMKDGNWVSHSEVRKIAGL